MALLPLLRRLRSSPETTPLLHRSQLLHMLRNRNGELCTILENTYRSRPRRAPGLAPPVDVAEVEKQLVSEMGEKVCIYEQICEHYAMQSLQPDVDAILDWEQIFRKFATSPKDDAEFYLLSIFLGDIVGSPHLCRQLAKRGRSCKGTVPSTSDYPPINLDNRVPTARPQQSQAVSWQYYYAPNAPQISAISPR